MKRMKPEVFVRRLAGAARGDAACRYTFFFGAGCSISSGIPGAAALVKEWGPRLKRHETGEEAGWEDWARDRFPEFNGDNHADLYGPVIEALFHTAAERQQEIERICSGQDPAFGYGVLAQLMGHENYGKNYNVVLTTNFDDLVADALYVYANRKPLVVTHESLIGFVRITPAKPYVIKLHGDARLAPKNIEIETEKLDESVERVLSAIFHETGLIFVGYGGNDASIIKLLDGVPRGAFPYGVYWVGSSVPGKMEPWLENRDAVWVQHRGFDELMLFFLEGFDLPHPDETRFTNILDRYRETFADLKKRISEQPATDEQRKLADAADKAAKKFKDWFAVELEARNYVKADPDKADEIYRLGLEQFPNEVGLLNNYGIFLKNVRRDYDRAERFFRHAIEVDPRDAKLLGNYAILLSYHFRDYDRAEEYYKRAAEADPNNATNLGNYAGFLKDRRKNYDAAETYFRRALDAEPNDALNVARYGVFLKEVRKDYERAEEYYRRAADATPPTAYVTANYAGFLLAFRDKEPGFVYLERGLAEAREEGREAVSLECYFYRYAHDAGPRGAGALSLMKDLLVRGVRSPRFDLSANVARAVADGHPEPAFLAALAAVVSDEAPLSSLDEFAAWKDAAP